MVAPDSITENSRITVLVNAQPMGDLIYDARNCDYNLSFSAPKDMTLSDSLRHAADMFDAERQKIVGECKQCMALLTEAENHVCKEACHD